MFFGAAMHRASRRLVLELDSRALNLTAGCQGADVHVSVISGRRFQELRDSDSANSRTVLGTNVTIGFQALLGLLGSDARLASKSIPARAQQRIVSVN